MFVPDPSSAVPAHASSGRECAGPNIPWDEAVERAHRASLGFCGVQRRHLAEDVAQESLRRLFLNAGRIHRGWKAMLSVIVLNVARTFLRREAARGARVRLDPAAVEAAPIEEPSPVDQALRAEDNAVVESLLAEVDAKFGLGTRAIIEFRCEGLPWEEIVKVAQLSERACRYRYKKALAWVRERFSLEGAEGGQND
jgi:DNA-directed RNA polymerase specialized sigma24 family protein